MKRLTIFFLLLLIISFLISYFRVPVIFFQQDELLGFGLFIKEGPPVILSGFNSKVVTHFVPVTMSLSYSLYSLFGLNYVVYNSLSLFLHLVNSFLVYLIAKRIFQNRLAVVISVVVFLSSNVAAELLMWPVINLNVISLTFSLLSWLVIFDKAVLKNIKGFVRIFLVSILFLLSVFSVEYAAGFALLIPATYVLLNQGSITKKLKDLWPFFFLIIAYCLVRLAPMIGAGGISSGGDAGLPIYLRWLELIPRYFGQLFWGQSFILWFSSLLAKLYPLQVNEVFVEKNISPPVSFVLGLMIIAISYVLYKKVKIVGKVYSKMFVLIFASIAVSGLPFLLIPGEAGSFSIFASRYMYFGLFGLAMYFGFVNDYLMEKSHRKLSLLILGLTLFLIFSGTLKNFQKGEDLYSLGKTRLEILRYINDRLVSIPSKLVIYTESDQSYYGLPGEEKILPFQSGLGQTLLIFLSQREKFPQEFYPGDFLWDIESQGYKEYEGRGFGYFRDLKLLRQIVEDKDLDKDSIYAFSWNGATGEIRNISDKIRQELKK